MGSGDVMGRIREGGKGVNGCEACGMLDSMGGRFRQGIGR